MPSKSTKQHNFMAAVAHSPSFAKKAGVPQSVGQEFMKADKGRKFSGGGEMKESKKMMEKEVAFMKKKGAPKSMVKHEEAEMKEGKNMRRGGFTGVAPGRVSTVARNMSSAVHPMVARGQVAPPMKYTPYARGNVGARGRFAEGGEVEGGKSMPKALAKHASMPASKAHAGLKSGGSVYRKSADGIAKKGKTQGMQVKMARGGKC